MADVDAQAVRREVRATLFPGVFDRAVLMGRASEADRDVWRELYIADPEAFDFAMAHDWVDVGSPEGSTASRESYLTETLRPNRRRAR